MSILITGGAGFVGSSLAKLYRNKYPSRRIVIFDNLKRRGSEKNLDKFKELNIEFIHGDIRIREDLETIPGIFDLFIEASAEPSVHAGMNGDPSYLIQTNLNGTVNCLNYARKNVNEMIFLSTSRVYAIEDLKKLKLESNGDRLVNYSGDIDENFSTRGFKSLYGATKFSSEELIIEYTKAYGQKVLINRCGVIAGSGQWGKVDQGVFTLWVANHFFNKTLSYTGFGGVGLQVRDLLHPSDLFDAIESQVSLVEKYNGEIFNLGGGIEVSTSLKELTAICEKVTGNKIEISSNLNTANVDIPYYVTNYTKAQEVFGFKPKVNVEGIVTDIYQWLKKDEHLVRGIFA